jgi:signal transduction histidine kinase
MTAPKIKNLDKMSDEELIEAYNSKASSTVVGTGFYLEEIRLRRQDKRNEKIENLTVRIYWLTLIVTMATLINVLIFIYTSFSA